MLDPIWSLVIASAIAVIGGIVVYKQMVAHLSESASGEDFQARRQQAYSGFVARFLVVELVSLPFLIYGVYHIVSGMVESTDVTLPLMVVLLMVLFGALSLYFTTSQITRDPHASDEVKNITNSMMMIGFGLITSFPVISLGLLLGLMFDVF